VSLVMKPVGASVHMRRGTVNRSLVGWLMLGSVPTAFLGVLIIRAIGAGAQDRLKIWLGVALLIAATCILVKMILGRRLEEAPPADSSGGIGVRAGPTIRPARTVAIGLVGGLMVGMTSVGSGSLIIIMLMLLYPQLTAAQLVGTDLAQAIPLVGSAALGHLLFGDVHFDLTGSLLVGSLPGIWIGSHLSAAAPDRIVRPVLFVVLAATGLKLVGAV
jgi:uncharacterized membrane protein YfcA